MREKDMFNHSMRPSPESGNTRFLSHKNQYLCADRRGPISYIASNTDESYQELYIVNPLLKSMKDSIETVCFFPSTTSTGMQTLE